MADAIAKHAPVASITTGTTQPGHYLILVAGDTASVDVAVDVVADAASDALLDHVYLPDIAVSVASAITSGSDSASSTGDAVGIVETATVASAIRAADAAVKDAAVDLATLRLADGLGGKAFFIIDGPIGEVTSAVAAASEAAGVKMIGSRVITQLTDEIRADLANSSHFGATVATGRGE